MRWTTVASYRTRRRSRFLFVFFQFISMILLFFPSFRITCRRLSVTAYSIHRTHGRQRFGLPWTRSVVTDQNQKGWQLLPSFRCYSTASPGHEVLNATTTPETEQQLSLKCAESSPSHNADDWRDHPDLNPTIHFRTWVVPVSGGDIQKVLSAPCAQPYLASKLDLMEHIHPRLKVVRDHKDYSGKKIILLHPDAPSSIADLPLPVQDLLDECHIDQQGPILPISFHYKQFTPSYILATILPPEVHPPPTAFETIGHVAHLNLRANHLPYKQVIGQVLLETLPNIETVIQKVGEVVGPYRTYEFELLAGRPETAVELIENGIQLQFDVADVYWCSRLSEERKRLLREEIRPQDVIADAFCGVGALCLQAAGQMNCTVWANDWNPKAIESLKQNAARNGVTEWFERIQCGDAYDFLMDLGLGRNGNEEGIGRLPDHVILNFPLDSPKFLGSLRWWPVERKRQNNKGSKAIRSGPRVHVYTFARGDPETERSAEDVAVDLVASNLLPQSGNPINRTRELNEEYDCQLKVHPVRDVAPGKLVLCVSFTATPKLLSYMQGDFR